MVFHIFLVQKTVSVDSFTKIDAKFLRPGFGVGLAGLGWAGWAGWAACAGLAWPGLNCVGVCLDNKN